MAKGRKPLYTLDVDHLKSVLDNLGGEPEEPSAIEQGKKLATGIGMFTNILDGKPIRIQDQTAIQESTRQPTGELLTPQPIDINRGVLQQQEFKKPEFEPTTAERLPFLDRDVTDKLPSHKFPEEQFTEQGTVETEGQPKAKDVPFQQRALNQINSFLLKRNLHSSGVGDLARELLTPIVAGGKRITEGQQQLSQLKPEGLGNIALGMAGAAFGTFMMPFGIARVTGTQLGGETAGKIAELSALGLSGGIPLIAGYFASQGATELADNLMEGKNLTEKQKETIQEVVGLFAFIGGAKATGKVRGAVLKQAGISPELYKKVLDYRNNIDKIVRKSLSPEKGQVKLPKEPRVSREEFEQKIRESKSEIAQKKKRNARGQFEKTTKLEEKPQKFEKVKTLAEKQKLGFEEVKPLKTKLGQQKEIKDVVTRTPQEKGKKLTETKKEAQEVKLVEKTTQVGELVQVGKQHLETIIEKGAPKATRFTEWSKKMKKEVGEWTKPHLLKVWSEIRGEVGEKKVRGFAKSTERRAIESGLVKEIKNLPEYEPKRDKPRIEEVSKVIANDFERAKRIALGEEKHPTVEAGFFHEGVRLVAEKNGDGNLIIELANSKISVQGTEAGQFIQALKDHNPLSTVRAVKEIMTERVARVKDFVGKKKTTINEVKTQMKKNNLKFKDWDTFIKSIKCV